VSYHEPYYTTQGPGSLAVYFQQNLEDLFYKYGVDIVINGHVHSYERTFPVYKGVVRICDACSLTAVHAHLCAAADARCQALTMYRPASVDGRGRHTYQHHRVPCLGGALSRLLQDQPNLQPRSGL